MSTENKILSVSELSPAALKIYDQMEMYRCSSDIITVRSVIDKIRPVLDGWGELSSNEKRQLIINSGWACILFYITRDHTILPEMYRLIAEETSTYPQRNPFCFKCSNIDQKCYPQMASLALNIFGLKPSETSENKASQRTFEELFFNSYDLHRFDDCWMINCGDSDCGCFDECTCCDIADLTDFN
jgi:hypothetical protein